MSPSSRPLYAHSPYTASYMCAMPQLHLDCLICSYMCLVTLHGIHKYMKLRSYPYGYACCISSQQVQIKLGCMPYVYNCSSQHLYKISSTMCALYVVYPCRQQAVQAAGCQHCMHCQQHRTFTCTVRPLHSTIEAQTQSSLEAHRIAAGSRHTPTT